MVNQKIIDWIKSPEAQGYSSQQIYSYLTQQGYSQTEINEALNITSKPLNVMTSSTG